MAIILDSLLIPRLAKALGDDYTSGEAYADSILNYLKFEKILLLPTLVTGTTTGGSPYSAPASFEIVWPSTNTLVSEIDDIAKSGRSIADPLGMSQLFSAIGNWLDLIKVQVVGYVGSGKFEFPLISSLGIPAYGVSLAATTDAMQYILESPMYPFMTALDVFTSFIWAGLLVNFTLPITVSIPGVMTGFAAPTIWPILDVPAYPLFKPDSNNLVSLQKEFCDTLGSSSSVMSILTSLGLSDLCDLSEDSDETSAIQSTGYNSGFYDGDPCPIYIDYGDLPSSINQTIIDDSTTEACSTKNEALSIDPNLSDYPDGILSEIITDYVGDINSYELNPSYGVITKLYTPAEDQPRTAIVYGKK